MKVFTDIELLGHLLDAEHERPKMNARTDVIAVARALSKYQVPRIEYERILKMRVTDIVKFQF